MLAVFAKAGWPLQRRFESGVVDLDWDLATTDEFLDSVERREQRADSRAVARILLPRAVAVIGASPRKGSVGSFLWSHIVGSVQVPIYPVNPRHDAIDGHPCLHSIDDLPDDVSLAIIAVPAAQLDETIDGCIRKRMGGFARHLLVYAVIDSIEDARNSYEQRRLYLSEIFYKSGNLVIDGDLPSIAD
jgi:predicted CoA-binding protein